MALVAEAVSEEDELEDLSGSRQNKLDSEKNKGSSLS